MSTSIRDYRIQQLAHEYYQRLIKYGVESASIWLSDNMQHEDMNEFKAIQPTIAGKYGLK